MTRYYAVIRYNDGYEVTARGFSKETALASVKSQNDNTQRVYKLNGVDYGPHGALLSMQELHGGIESIFIHEYTKTNVYEIDKSSL